MHDKLLFVGGLGSTQNMDMEAICASKKGFLTIFGYLVRSSSDFEIGIGIGIAIAIAIDPDPDPDSDSDPEKNTVIEAKQITRK